MYQKLWFALHAASGHRGKAWGICRLGLAYLITSRTCAGLVGLKIAVPDSSLFSQSISPPSLNCTLAC
jgi:hypothetical protein